MKRWNGWGDETITYPLPEPASTYLEQAIGRGASRPDASLEQVISTIPPSSLTTHPMITCDPTERLLHARGQSLPDWVALRSGRIETFPDGVAYPTTESEVRSMLEYARQTGARIIPYGGGTSVVGHINPRPEDIPTLTLDLHRLDDLLDLDETSLHATFEAGINGPKLEAKLNTRGYTLGHFPQSWEFSTLGGWIATRSSGQQSYYYGRIENLFAGGHIETPIGPLDLPPFPASAAGPDLREIILGSEGRLGVITRAIVRVRPLPEVERFYAAFFRDWETGMLAVRSITQADIQVSMLRLSDAQETETMLVLAGRERLVNIAGRALCTLGYGQDRCLLIYGLTGDRKKVAHAHRQTKAILRSHGGLPTGATIGNIWLKSRFHTPYLRNTLWKHGYALDTVETALPWSAVSSAAEAIKAVIHGGLAEEGERVLAFAHLSHVYRDGASVYVTFMFRRASSPDETLQRWRILKTIASENIIAHGGTISHQHGVGNDHLPYIASEKGKVGLQALGGIQRELDPNGLLNPGKMFPQLTTDLKHENLIPSEAENRT